MKVFAVAVLESIGKIGLTVSMTMPVRLLATMVNEERKAPFKKGLHGTISCCSAAPTATSTSCSAAVGLALWIRRLLLLLRFRYS
jgi:hypothetical protein